MTAVGAAEVTAARAAAQEVYRQHITVSALAADVMVAAEAHAGVLATSTSLHTLTALTRRGLTERTGERALRRRGGRVVQTYHLTDAGRAWLAGARHAGRIPPAATR